MSDPNRWAGRKVGQMRAVVAGWLAAGPMPCGQCNKPVSLEDQWVVGHKEARVLHPELTWSLANVQPEHKACSDKSGQSVAMANAVRKAGFSPQLGPSPVAAPSRTYTGRPVSIRKELEWASLSPGAPVWLQPLLTVPQDASPPKAMTPVHPDAVDSYGDRKSVV